MVREPADVKEWGGLFFRGLVIKIAPDIAKGMLIEIFKAKKTSGKGAIDWVQNNVNLWKSLEPDERATFKDLAQRIGSVDWLNADWVIDSIKGDFPAVASLFLGWRKANNWLKRQVEIIRKEVEGKTIPNSEPIKLRKPSHHERARSAEKPRGSEQAKIREKTK